MKDQNEFEKLSTEAFLGEALPVLQRIFNFPGSMLNLFPEHIPFRIVDVDDGTVPVPYILKILKKIGSDNNYKGFYYVFMNLQGPNLELSLPGIDDKRKIESWYIPFDDLDKVRNIISPICCAIFSPKGDWGILVTTEDFLLLGSTKEVGEEIQKALPNVVNASIERFFQMYNWRRTELKTKWDWLPELFHNLYRNSGEDFLEKYTV